MNFISFPIISHLARLVTLLRLLFPSLCCSLKLRSHRFHKNAFDAEVNLILVMNALIQFRLIMPPLFPILIRLIVLCLKVI